MPILIILTVAVQAFFIFHVIRTGRPYWWAFVILSFPLGGSLIYYLVEVFPSSREQRRARKAMHGVMRSLRPDAELRRRAEELEICGSLDNRLAMARECEAGGMHHEAARLYRSCLAGAYATDPQILFLLAHAELMSGHAAEAARLVQQLESEKPDFKPLELRLLRARVLEESDTAAALDVYEALAPVYPGLEARCRHAALLRRLGHRTQARMILEEVLQHARRFSISHEGEQAWIRFARDGLQD